MISDIRAFLTRERLQAPFVIVVSRRRKRSGGLLQATKHRTVGASHPAAFLRSLFEDMWPVRYLNSAWQFSAVM
jgi:hypothetical protein